MERRVGIKKQKTHQDALTYSSRHWISTLEHKAPRTTGSKKQKKKDGKKKADYRCRKDEDESEVGLGVVM